MQQYKWFRMYSDFAKDPKVQSMSEVMQRRLMMLFCLKCSEELDILSEEEIAFSLSINIETFHETIALFKKKGFLTEEGKIRNWDKRQYKSDLSTDRVKKYREKQTLKEVKRFRNVTVTPPDTESDTESDSIKGNIKRKNEVKKPENVCQEVWDDFVKHRKDKNAPVTQTAMNGIIKQAEKANWTTEEALIEICTQGWQGFKAQWVTAKAKPQENNMRKLYKERENAK